MYRKKRATRRPYQKKRKVYRKRNSNNVVGGPNTCKVIETLPAQIVDLNQAYEYVKTGITGSRASAAARIFGLYRIARIIWTYRPVFDTYSSSLPGTGNSPNAVPYLYWKMNRFGDAPAAFNGDYMRSLGAKPFRLDDKNVVISYKPNTLVVQDNGAGATAASVKITPWLSTDDTPQDALFTLSTAEHFGHTLYVEGGGAGTAQGAVATLDIKVIYEFKNPRQLSGTGDVQTNLPVSSRLQQKI